MLILQPPSPPPPLSARSLPLTYSAEFVSSGDCVKRFRPHSGTPVAKETTKSGGGTDRVCMRRRSRTLPWGRSAPRSYLGGVVVAPSLHSRSVNTDLIKTSRSSTRSPVRATNGGSSFNGAFLPECVSDQCFRSTAGANAVLSLPLSMEICAHPVHGHRASGAVRVAALVFRGHLVDVGGRSSSIMRNAFRKIARGFGRPLR